MKEIIICVAPVPNKIQEEKLPGTMNVAQELLDCFNAGASIGHLHVRNEEGLQTSDTNVFQADIEKTHSACPIIIEGSTGGMPEHTLQERCVSFRVPGVEMGSLNMGSINFADGVYQNKIADILFYAGELKERNLVPFIACFDLSHFRNLQILEERQLVSIPYNFGMVFDIPSTLPYEDRYLEFFLGEIPKGSNWFLVRHHAKGSDGFHKAIELGGHVRVGNEDGPFLSNGRHAGSNAELVEEVARAAEKVGRHVVGPDRAREILGLEKRGNR